MISLMCFLLSLECCCFVFPGSCGLEAVNFPWNCCQFSCILFFFSQKPSSVRIDQLDREQFNPDVITFPIIVHFGIRPAQLSYAGDPQ